MAEIRNIKLELLRPGPAHNQLLSPLTPYLALCGADGPVTVHMPFEHRQLLNRLERLRYGTDTAPIIKSQQESEVREMGEVVGNVLGQIPGLISLLNDPSKDSSRLVHLRLSLSAFELGLVPFELAISPDGFPQSGSPLFLQAQPKITITREIRRSQPLPVSWNRKPRILFAYATPAGLAQVPALEHLQAIRRAIEPWVKIKDTPGDRIEEVKKILTVLPDATIEKIREACSSTKYTHVHLLAHGAPFDKAGVRRYGLMLANSDVIDGEGLGLALLAGESTVIRHGSPTVVSLATCDSGNINSVITPGGSIAHELHAAGIPWVVASQFPLWMRASSIAAEVLFAGLLNGTDPREVLYTLRQRLRIESAGTHDWASIVAYAIVPWNFDYEVAAFRDKQTRAKLEVKFARIDDLAGVNTEENAHSSADKGKNFPEIKNLCASIRDDLAAWREEPIATKSASVKAERLGMSAASEKRIGIAFTQLEKFSESVKAYERSLHFYRLAIETEPSNHWVITQYLSLLAVTATGDQAKSELQKYRHWWLAARQIAEWQLRSATGNDRIWALGTLAEITLLSAIYDISEFDATQAKNRIIKICEEIYTLTGENTFPLFSTQRQFKRYLDYWQKDEWNELAKTAVDNLAKRL